MICESARDGLAQKCVQKMDQSFSTLPELFDRSVLACLPVAHSVAHLAATFELLCGGFTRQPSELIGFFRSAAKVDNPGMTLQHGDGASSPSALIARARVQERTGSTPLATTISRVLDGMSPTHCNRRWIQQELLNTGKRSACCRFGRIPQFVVGLPRLTRLLAAVHTASDSQPRVSFRPLHGVRGSASYNAAATWRRCCSRKSVGVSCPSTRRYCCRRNFVRGSWRVRLLGLPQPASLSLRASVAVV